MASRAWTPGALRWVLAPPFDGAEAMARRLGVAPLVAQVLANRGLTDVEAAKAFLAPKLSDLHDPLLLPGVVPAAERIARAVAAGERIVIYGDYDVDGMTAVAILHACLRMLGARAEFYVPHRLDEGYGVNTEAVRKIVADGAELIVTVDCGISAAGPLRQATDAGVDVIVTDHHSPPEVLPDVVAVVHPRVPGSEYPNADLSGAGVAFKLAWQVARAVCGRDRVDEPMRNFLLDATCLAALGTIADVVPLVGENRSLATYGLRGLPETTHPGLRALLEAADLTGTKLDAYHVGFLLAPRLNACGRMGHARLAVELLTDAAPDRCRSIAQYLNQQNAERQKVERAIAAEAVEMVVARGLDAPEHRIIVLASEDWHGGVIGIVASRLVDRFGRPAILVAFNGDGGQGSGRSVPGFHMRDALAACSEHLVSFGGHAMAGGIRIERDRIEAFAEAMGAYARQNLRAEDLTACLNLDAEATLASLSYATASHVARMAPFGQGNPEPVVAVRSCQVVGPPRRMGRGGGTASVVLAQNGAKLRAVGFGMGDLADHLVGIHTVDVAAVPRLNTFRGATNVELELKDVAWE
ncbi:MAG TPA: single-stranded-DNA-specific exonuclease RecJ [Phycisphaerae bacterium]|nr:single-stranded-DNA-specific exonuclease RecJ [Phycisphaerae bacterium]